MTKIVKIHASHPQTRVLQQVATVIAQGGVVVYPTDSCYALGCALGNKQAIERIRLLRQLPQTHHFTLICRDLSQLATYARVSNAQYRILRNHTPGAYTFLLPATREVPRRLQHPKRKSIGIRVPDHVALQALLDVLEEPLMSVTLRLPDREFPLIEPDAMGELLAGKVDIIIDGGYCGTEPTTVLDLTGDDSVKILRIGKGDTSAFSAYE